MATSTVNPPPQQDPFAALGATYEDAQPAAQKPAPAHDPFASLGAQFEDAAPAAPAQPQAPPPSAAMADAARLNQANAEISRQMPNGSVQATPNQPGLWDRIRNSAVGHAVQTTFPNAPDWMKPTDVAGTSEYRENAQATPRVLPEWASKPLVESTATDTHETESAKSLEKKWNGFKQEHPTIAAVLNPVGAESEWEKNHPNVAAARQSVDEFSKGMTSPEGIAQLGLGLFGKLGKVNDILNGIFSVQVAQGTYESAEEARKQYKAGNNPGATGAATTALLNAVLGAGMVHHAASGGTHVAVPEEEAPGEAARPAEPAAAAPADPFAALGAEFEKPTETSQAAKPSPAGEKLTTDVAKSDKVSDPFKALGAEYENSDVVPRGTEAHPPIGETEPETGRPVLQQSPRPEVNQAAATAEHPAIKDALHEITQPIEGAEVAGARAEKDEDRLDDKIDDGQSPRTVRDYSGFRIAVESPEARDQVVSALKAKFEVPNETDEFEAGHPENGFHGHTLQVREPGSPVTHEVQILPREVADAAEERHPLYEKAREGDQAAQAELKAANQADYQKFVERTNAETKGGRGESPEQPGAEPLYKSGSTQANIDPNSEAAAALKTAREKIAPEDRAGNVNGTEGGIETQPHVTVRYGLKGDDHGQVRKFIASQAPFEATLGPTDKFPASENSDGAVPIISHIDAPELHRINGEIEQHGDFEKSDFPDYKPHATLGYVKPEAAEKYTGMRDTEGKKFTVRSIAISDRNGNLEEIPLKGSKAEGKSQQSEGNSRFKTSLGSEYQVHDDGTTTRNKAFRSEHGEAEQGPQPRSEQTFYVSAEDAQKLGEFQTQGGAKKIIHSDGKHAGVRYVDGPDAGKIERRTAVEIQEKPAAGLIPVETWNGGAKVHFGNEITEVEDASSQPGATSVHQRQPEEDGVPGDGRGRVEPGLEGQGPAGAGSLFGEEKGPVAAPAAEVKPNSVGRVRVQELKADPKRFQYKMNTDEAGTTDLLKGRKWNDALAGVISVWRDPADGQTYVVNGHHRFELASGSQVPEMNVLMLDAPDAETARSIGALQNIAEGRGTPMDAAKFFRDSGFTPEEIDKSGISMGEATARNGIALSRLDDRIFDDVVSGKLRQNRAIAIGNATDVAEEQDAILKLIEKAEARGRKVSDDTVDELARMAKSAGSHTDTQQTLFGAQEMTRNLALEKAEVSSYVRDQIGKEKRLFGSVADEARAGRLAQGGNKINPAKNRAIAESAAHAQELYDRLSTKAGDVDEILSRAAQALAGGENGATVKQRSYDEIRRALSETLGEPKAGKPERVQESGGSGQETLPAATQRQALKAPVPPDRAPRPEKTERWEKGEHFLVRDPATGDFRTGEVTYFNEGNQPQAKAGGRSRLSDGTRLDEIPRDAMRIRASEKPIRPIADTEFEREIIGRVKAHLPKLVGDYLERFTEGGVPTLATDAAKELFPEFKADPTGTDRETAAGGKAIRDSALATVLSSPVDPKRPDVLITTASPGSGKTNSQSGETSSGVAAKIEAIADDFKSFRGLVQQVIDSGRRPVIQWVHVDEPAKTVRRMFLRAIGHGERPGIGRTVQLKYMADAYTQVPRVLERIREEFGDKVRIEGVDNSGAPGTAKVTLDIDPLIESIKSKPYNQVVEEMADETRKLQSEGHFDSDRGKAILKAAEANDPAGSDEAARRRPGPEGSRSAGQPESGPGQGSEVPGTVLKDTQPKEAVDATGGSQSPAGSVSPEEFKQGLDSARKRSLRDNAATQQARAIETEHGKAVLMDPDAMALWYRSGLGEKAAWRGLSLPKGLANKVELVLRSMAGSSRAETGGADAAAGYDRMAKAFKEGRNEDGSVTLLRGDYRPDTVLEEAWHNWQRSNRIVDSDAMRMVAQRPEVKEIADRLRELGYGVRPGIEGRTELAMEMMAKALAGDPDLDVTPEQRYNLAHGFLAEAVKEFGPEILKKIPGVTPEAKAALADARRTYEPDEAGRGRAARGEDARPGEGAKARPGVEEGAGDTRGRAEPAPPGDERGAPGPGEEEDQLAYQRAKKAAPLRPEDSLALPGMEDVDREMRTARGEAQAGEMTDKMREPIADISKAAGEMERNSPLFAGNDQVNGQGLLFQRGEEGNPVARRVQDLIDELAKEPRNDSRSALEKVRDFTGRTLDESTSRSAKTLREVPSKLENAWSQAKLITAALVDGFRHPLKTTDWKRSIGEMDLARAQTALKLKKLGLAIKDAAPDRLSRIGMTHFIEAGGDPKKLDEWALMASERWKQRRGDPNIDPRLKNHLADSVEHYKAATELTAEQKAIATRIKQHFSDMLQVAKDNGLLEYGARNYVRHLYETADAADLVKLLDTNELNPNPGFLEKRIFRTYWDAENAGMIPRNKDLGYLVTAYDKSFNQAIASRSMLRSLLDGRGQDGRPLAAIRLRGKWVTVGEDQKPLVLEQRERPNSLAGYKYLDLAPTRNFLFEPTREDLDGYEYDPKLFEEDPSRLAFKGDLIFHPEVSNRVDDMLTPGWFDRNENAAQKIGHKVLTGSAAAKEMMTMVAPFHMVQLAEHSVEHWVNPLKLPELDLDGKSENSRRQQLLASNGLGLMDFDAEGLFSARTLKGLADGIPGVNVAMDAVNSLSRWQFEDVIPRMKMKMAMQAFDRNWKSYGAKLEAEQFDRVKDKDLAHETAERMVAELTAKQANAAFGNLNTAFDSIHRSKTFKQLLRLTMFAPDFLESRIRYTAQAFTRYGGEQRAAFARGALGMYVIARAANALLNNGDTKNDLEHAFTVVAGGKNYSLRSQVGDLVHLITDPRGFIYNRLNPMTVRPVVEYLNGRDQFGRQKSGKSQLKDLAKSVLPFGVQKIIQTPDEGWLDSILSSSGVVTSNYRSPAEEMAHKLLLRNIPDLPDDPEKQAQNRAKYQLEEAIREGKKKPADAIDLAKNGTLTLRQAWNIVDRSGHSKLYNEFASGTISIIPKNTGDPSALDIYAAATPSERMELRPALINKGENQLPDIRKQAPARRAEIHALEKQWEEQAKLDPKFKVPERVPDSQFEVLAALWRSLLASTPHEKGVPAAPAADKGAVAQN